MEGDHTRFRVYLQDWIDAYQGAVAHAQVTFVNALTQKTFCRVFYYIAKQLHFLTVYAPCTLSRREAGLLPGRISEVFEEASARLASLIEGIRDVERSAGSVADTPDAPLTLQVRIPASAPYCARFLDLLTRFDGALSMLHGLQKVETISNYDRAMLQGALRRALRVVPDGLGKIQRDVLLKMPGGERAPAPEILPAEELDDMEVFR